LSWNTQVEYILLFLTTNDIQELKRYSPEIQKKIQIDRYGDYQHVKIQMDSREPKQFVVNEVIKKLFLNFKFLFVPKGKNISMKKIHTFGFIN
jgi:hypothetical protein